MNSAVIRTAWEIRAFTEGVRLSDRLRRDCTNRANSDAVQISKTSSTVPLMTS